MRAEDPTPRNRRRLDANEPEGDAPLRRRRTRSAENLDAPTEGAATPKPNPRPKAASTPKPRAKRATAASTPKVEPVKAAVTEAQPAPRAHIAASTAPRPDTPADTFLLSEISRARKNYTATIWLGGLFVVAVWVSLYYLTTTFTSNLEPQSAATIAKGMIGQNITDHLPELKSYAKEQVPILIAQVPDYVKTELPKYRQNLVNKLESDIGAYAKQTAPELGAKMDDFFKQNKDAVGQLMQNNQDPVAQAAVSAGLKNMFGDYLRSAQINKETLESKISQSLTALDSVDNRLKHLAANKGLTDNEKRARRAIAIVLLKVDENQPKLAEITDNAKQQIDATPLNGVLQWKNNDEAVFTAPGKPPVIFKRVTPVGSFSSATKPNGPSEGAKAKGTQQEKKAATASATSH